MSPIHHRGRNLDLTHKKLRYATFRLKCFIWPEKDASSEPISGFCFLADITEKNVAFYLNRKLRPATWVRISIERELSATYRGVILWSERFTLEHHFLGQTPLSFRAGAKLQFGSEAERQRFKAYVMELRSRALEIK